MNTTFTNIVSFLLISILLCLSESEALLPLSRIVGRGAAGTVLGRLSLRRQRNGAFPPQNPSTTNTDLLSPSSDHEASANEDATFNPELYRQEMTTLVYQRSLERGLA